MALATWRRTALLAAALVPLLLSSSLHANVMALPADRDSEPCAGPTFAVPDLTAEQLEAFSHLVGEPQAVVLRHLQLDPGLMPLAVSAATERIRRKRSGKIRAVVGFSIFGAGLIAGYVVKESSRTMSCSAQPDTCDSDRSTRSGLGIFIGVVAAAVGLGIGIPGLVRMGKQSEAEYDALNRYLEPAQPPPLQKPASAVGSGRLTVSLPLFSVSF